MSTLQVDFAFRTLDDWGDEKYQNTGIAIKGSPDGVWNQFLYDRGSSKGQVGKLKDFLIFSFVR